MKIQDSVAIVTGGAGLLGRALCNALFVKGGKVGLYEILYCTTVNSHLGALTVYIIKKIMIIQIVCRYV